MKDSKLKAAQLIDRYLDGNCTDQERQLVEQVYSKVALAKIVRDRDIDFSGIGRESWAYIAAETAQGVEPGARTGLEVRYEPEVVTLKSRSVFRLWRGIAAAAAVAAITLGTWIYHPAVILNLFQDPNAIAMKNDIAPGKNTATLTLADGKTIVLSNSKTGVIIDAGSLKYNDNTLVIQSDSEGSKPNAKDLNRTLTINTPRGGTYQVVLPDGTEAWLNAASSIKFPSSFAGTGKRRIEMTGEVYLEVAKDKSRPFIVESNGQQIEVLGTHFNVNAYTDEGNVKTTLLEGSVKVSRSAPLNDGQDDEAMILRPGQESILSNTNRIVVKQVNPSEAVAWKEGNFVFNNEDIGTIMRHIARWYNIEVKYEGSLPAGEFSGNVSRSKNISQVLQALELTKLVHFKVEGRTVVVTK